MPENGNINQQPASKRAVIAHTAARGLHASQGVARRVVGKGIEIADKRRTRTRGARKELTAHIHQSKEVAATSRMIPESFRVQYSSELVLNMYRKHLGRGKDYKGLFFCAYGSSGYFVGLSASIDILQLLLSPVAPPFIAPSAKLNVEVKGGAVEHLLLFVHRAFPNGLQMYSHRYQVPGGPQYDQYNWQTVSPICFMTLRGWEKRIEVSAGFEAGVSIGLPSLNIDGHSLTLDAANFQAGIRGGCRLYHLEDKLPGWYPHITDQRLEYDFFTVASPAKTEVKKLYNEWRKYLRDTYFKSVLTSQNPVFNPLRTLLNQRLTLDVSFSRGIFVHSSQEVEAWLNKLRTVVHQLTAQRVLQFPGNSYADLDNYLQTAILTLRNAKYQETASSTAREKLPLKHRYLPIPGNDLPNHHTRHCFADMTVWAMSTGASASSGISAAQEFSLGQIHTTDSVADDSAISAGGLGLSAGISVTGDARFMSSRYQTQAPSSKGRYLILTQDTKVTYTQVAFNYQAGVTVNLPFDIAELGYQLSNGRLLKNDINYYSATAYWQLSGEEGVVALEEGSGINFGVSISFKRLKALRDPRTPVAKNIKRYPYYLGISQTAFLSFVRSIPGEFFEPAFMRENPYILLESSFRFVNQEFGGVNEKGQLRSLVHQYFGKGKFQRSPNGQVELESIKCRVRLGTEIDRSAEVFKLGLHVAGVGLGISLQKVKRAGNMFIEDFYTWMNPALRAPSATAGQVPPSRPGQSQAVQQAALIPPTFEERERMVPATVLLPHTFQID
jgi:hypothetical protein